MLLEKSEWLMHNKSQSQHSATPSSSSRRVREEKTGVLVQPTGDTTSGQGDTTAAILGSSAAPAPEKNGARKKRTSSPHQTEDDGRELLRRRRRTTDGPTFEEHSAPRPSKMEHARLSTEKAPEEKRQAEKAPEERSRADQERGIRSSKVLSSSSKSKSSSKNKSVRKKDKTKSRPTVEKERPKHRSSRGFPPPPPSLVFPPAPPNANFSQFFSILQRQQIKSKISGCGALWKRARAHALRETLEEHRDEIEALGRRLERDDFTDLFGEPRSKDEMSSSAGKEQVGNKEQEDILLDLVHGLEGEGGPKKSEKPKTEKGLHDGPPPGREQVLDDGRSSPSSALLAPGSASTAQSTAKIPRPNNLGLDPVDPLAPGAIRRRLEMQRLQRTFIWLLQQLPRETKTSSSWGASTPAGNTTSEPNLSDFFEHFFLDDKTFEEAFAQMLRDEYLVPPGDFAFDAGGGSSSSSAGPGAVGGDPHLAKLEQIVFPKVAHVRELPTEVRRELSRLKGREVGPQKEKNDRARFLKRLIHPDKCHLQGATEAFQTFSRWFDARKERSKDKL